MAVCPACSGPLPDGVTTCARCSSAHDPAKPRAGEGLSETAASAPPGEPDGRLRAKPWRDGGGCSSGSRQVTPPLQVAWSERGVEVGFCLGLVFVALFGLYSIGECILSLLAHDEARSSTAGMSFLAGLLSLALSPLAGMFAGFTFGLAGMILQGTVYFLTGRYRRVPNAEAVIDRLDDMRDEELYGNERVWRTGPERRDERVQSPPNTGSEDVRKE